MKKFLMLFLAVSASAMACNDEYTKEYFEKDGHLYFTVTGNCRGKVQYTMHSADCPCGDGAYEVISK